jgi:hypothetical protein
VREIGYDFRPVIPPGAGCPKMPTMNFWFEPRSGFSYSKYQT